MTTRIPGSSGRWSRPSAQPASRPSTRGKATADLRVFLTPEQLELVRDAAGRDGLGPAPWARGILVRQAERRLADLPEVDVAPAPAPISDVERVERQLGAALARKPQPPDRQLADELGVTVAVVRHYRRSRGIEGAVPVDRPHRWEAPIREAHALGLDDDAIAARTSYSRRSVQEYRSRLGLAAHPKGGLPPEPE